MNNNEMVFECRIIETFCRNYKIVLDKEEIKNMSKKQIIEYVKNYVIEKFSNDKFWEIDESMGDFEVIIDNIKK